jgi:hypothetical protein
MSGRASSFRAIRPSTHALDVDRPLFLRFANDLYLDRAAAP